MVRNLAVACLLVVTMVASTAWGQKELKCDQVVKNPVGFAGLGTQFDSKEDCEKALASKAAELYSKALDQASGFCKMWYTCPKEWPLYYAAGKTQEEACKCTNHEGPNRDKWSGSCSLIWNGVCGCQSPSDNPGLSHLVDRPGDSADQGVVPGSQRLSDCPAQAAPAREFLAGSCGPGSQHRRV